MKQNLSKSGNQLKMWIELRLSKIVVSILKIVF